MDTTYFGMWSAKKIREVSIFLSELGVCYEVTEEPTEQKGLEDWCAWDATAENPCIGFDLWICFADLEKLGTKLVEKFPGAKIWCALNGAENPTPGCAREKR